MISYLGLINPHWRFTGRHEPEFPLRRVVRSDRGLKRGSVKVCVALLIWIHFAAYDGIIRERFVAEMFEMWCVCEMGQHL